MNYLKVLWVQHNIDYPVVMYSELSDDRFEVRKVELYSDGTLTYACDTDSKGSTKLGKVAVPSIQEIASNPEFNPIEISKTEFEDIWDKAMAK